MDNSIKIEVNNSRTMKIFRDLETKSITVTTGTKNNIDSNFNISDSDMVMLINYYRYIKDNNIQCDFINPNGINKE